MVEFRDDQGAGWSVQRCWWPSPGSPDLGGLDVEGFLLGLALWLAALVWWPLWFLAKWCGVRWKIVVRHEGQMVRTEKVRGWDTSQHRIEEIALSLRAGVVAHRLISPDAQVANPQR